MIKQKTVGDIASLVDIFNNNNNNNKHNSNRNGQTKLVSQISKINVDFNEIEQIQIICFNVLDHKQPPYHLHHCK